MVRQYISVWLGGTAVRALDLRLEIARSIPAAALSSATLGKLFTHINASVTKQYNLVPVERRWCSDARKVTAGLASRWTRVTLWFTLHLPGSQAQDSEMSTHAYGPMHCGNFTYIIFHMAMKDLPKVKNHRGVHPTDSHDAAPSPVSLSLSTFCPSAFLTGVRGYQPQENFGIKDACTRVLEHFRHKKSTKFCHPLTSLFLSPKYFREAFCAAGGCLWTPPKDHADFLGVHVYSVLACRASQHSLLSCCDFSRSCCKAMSRRVFSSSMRWTVSSSSR